VDAKSEMQLRELQIEKTRLEWVEGYFCDGAR